MVNVKIRGIEVGPSDSRVVCNVGTLECALMGIAQGASIIEARCDLVPPPNEEHIETFIKDLRDQISAPIIATILKTVDGGDWYRFKKSDQERLPIFKKLMPYIDAIDIECQADIKGQIINLCRDKGKTIVLSYHNMGHTPSREELCGILMEMEKEDCDVIKIACFVRDEQEYNVLFELLLGYISKKKSKPLCVIPMGSEGRHGRHIFPWYGSCLTYGCVREEKAPAQPFVHELVKSLSFAKSIVGTLPIPCTNKGTKKAKELSESLPSYSAYSPV